MNGYELHRAAYQKLLADETDPEVRENIEKKITALSFMADNDRQTQFELFNSAGFNDICRGYCLMALNRMEVDDKTTSGVIDTLKELFDFVGAEEAEQYYYKH